jgi:hypothetical protein
LERGGSSVVGRGLAGQTCFGIITTHYQKHKTTVTTASGNRYTVLLSVASVEELELI